MREGVGNNLMEGRGEGEREGLVARWIALGMVSIAIRVVYLDIGWTQHREGEQ